MSQRADEPPGAGEQPIRVLLVDDHAVVRKGLRALLDREPGIEVTDEAEDGEQALRAADRLQPDVILMDLEMPGIGGIEATRRITETHLEIKVVVLTSHAAEEDVFPALKAGALGYLLKHSAPEDVLGAIRQAYRGETVLHPAIARLVLQELQRPAHPERAAITDPLSDRELDVLRLIARGLSNHEIAGARSWSARPPSAATSAAFSASCKRIRGATPNDVPFLRRMQWEALMASPRFVAAMGLEHLRQIEERVWATWPAPGDAAFVAEDAHGRPLGALILRVQERDGERVVGHRLAIAVELDARRQGIGRQLLEHAKRFSQAAGADYLLLQVDPSNEPALRAYLATGFQLGDVHGVAPMIVRFDAEAHLSSPSAGRPCREGPAADGRRVEPSPPAVT